MCNKGFKKFLHFVLHCMSTDCESMYIAVKVESFHVIGLTTNSYYDRMAFAKISLDNSKKQKKNLVKLLDISGYFLSLVTLLFLHSCTTQPTLRPTTS